MPSKLNNNQQAELAWRIKEFCSTPSSERTSKLPGIKYSLCENEEMTEFSNVVLNGEPTESEILEFVTHANQCNPCKGNFTRLLWATTGD